MAQLVEHHLAKVRVAGSNPVVRSEGPYALAAWPFVAEWPSGLGKGLQSPVHGFDSRLRLFGSRLRSGTVIDRAALCYVVRAIGAAWPCRWPSHGLSAFNQSVLSY